ncbi:(deoxy)nucleoside triphosphate pyrophosphohydrolase [Schaalia sp. lx-260]|uniref:(deoxy)nucleoside triphosphate pyrophosphohydrolase n=1 Tax=Schaalia sp. lx-260 TaxID=2899082 RepID=UPI001E2C1688|nr:NUDIX domain-containing protein [Schaalia sp. lx-260]MCD4548975.1 NUDIX domain-containing protein [Schaalia sp. lx-260]
MTVFLNESTRLPRPVVAAAIVNSLHCPTHLLCAARSYPQHLRGLYELPGGKIEENESPLQALAREIREELGWELTYGKEICDSSGAWWPIGPQRHMGVWLSEYASPDLSERPAKEFISLPQLPTLTQAHVDIRWQPLHTVETLPWIPANLTIVREITRVCEQIRAQR